MHRIVLSSIAAAAGLTALACDGEPTWSGLGASDVQLEDWGSPVGSVHQRRWVATRPPGWVVGGSETKSGDVHATLWKRD
jgi:hypothetical protein